MLRNLQLDSTMKILLLLTGFTIVHGRIGWEIYPEPGGSPSLKIKIIGQEHQLWIEAGRPFSLSCQIYGAQEQVWWTINQKNLTNPADNSNSTTTLIFPMPDRSDDGYYTCVAIKTADEELTEKTVRIRVMVGESTREVDPEPEKLPSLEIKILGQHHEKIVAGIPFSLSCQIYGAQGQVWWTRNKKNLTNPVDNTNWTTTLPFTMPDEYDAGYYTCVARDTAGTNLNEKSIHIRVIEPGNITTQLVFHLRGSNDSASVSCHAEEVDGKKLSWDQNTFYSGTKTVDAGSGLYERSSKRHIIALRYLANIAPSDEAVYMCTKRIGRLRLRGSNMILKKTVAPQVNNVGNVKAVGAHCIQWNVLYTGKEHVSRYVNWFYSNDGTKETGSSGISSEDLIVVSCETCGLESNTAYEIIFYNYKSGVDSPIARSGWVTTWEKNIAFSPKIWIEATTVHSITIGWPPPPEHLREIVHGYLVILREGDKVLYYARPTVESGKFDFLDLRPGINYSLTVVALHRQSDEDRQWKTTQEIVTKDRDPIFIPTASVKTITTPDSITMIWSMPPPELRDRVHQYKVTAAHRSKTIVLTYVNATENSYVFENLSSETSYLVKVAACSDLATQCGNWSAEHEVLTIQRGSAIWPSVIVVVVLLFSIMITWMSIRKRRERALRKRFMEEILNHYNNVVLDCLNPELNLADQAQRMSYDQKWEFPRKLLKLDKILGSGAFGIVRKAQAKSICRGEPVTTVAVKMVRATASLNYMTALSRELKILAYLGKHLNVVNLLGACTENISHGELLVIVEFCRFGNLHDYLRRCRADFRGQSDTFTDNISENPNSSSDPVNANDSGMETETRDPCQSTDATDTRVAVDVLVPVTDIVAPTWPSKYEGDYTDDNLDPIGTRDLLCWAWQLARGMKYLGSRRVLHGDLAARNVLLADNNVVKICDFGLSKAMLTDENYKKEGHDPLPVKWMAIESIRDRVFSVHSDIWSYGIVLWEFFTLAETPYSGIHAQNVYQKLVEGFRMMRPKYASEDIYHFMLQCWDEEPLKRPSFDKLEHSIGRLLDDDVKTHYFHLSASYIQLDDEPLAIQSAEHPIMRPSEDAVRLSQPQNKIDLTSGNDAQLTNPTS